MCGCVDNCLRGRRYLAFMLARFGLHEGVSQQGLPYSKARLRSPLVPHCGTQHDATAGSYTTSRPQRPSSGSTGDTLATRAGAGNWRTIFILLRRTLVHSVFRDDRARRELLPVLRRVNENCSNCTAPCLLPEGKSVPLNMGKGPARSMSAHAGGGVPPAAYPDRKKQTQAVAPGSRADQLPFCRRSPASARSLSFSRSFCTPVMSPARKR